ncbi:nitrogen fixation protein [Achromatium sp. WMS3]|nr:nitrogen fixation protein [Achromatium sp. WMS3]
MRIAVTSQNFRTITGHAGKARRFIVYEADGLGTVKEQERLDLPAELSIHEYRGADHPLFGLNLQALITQSAGPGFIQHLNQRNITVHVTGEDDPTVAVAQVASGQPVSIGEPSACTCHHKH